MGWLRFVLPFAAIALIQFELRPLFASLGQSSSAIASALATFGLGIFAVLLLRHWQGRRSRDAYVTFSATAIPLVAGGFEIGDLVTGGDSNLVSALVCIPLALLISLLTERLLYTSEERKIMRVIATGRAKPMESPK